jgi:hypothetical protein
MWKYFAVLIAVLIAAEAAWRYFEKRIPENINNRYDEDG